MDNKLKIKIEQKESHEPSTTNVVITDQESGLPIGCVQKITWSADAKEMYTKCTLEIVNPLFDVIESEADVEPITFGRHFLTLEDMTPDDMCEALLFEGRQRYLQNLEIGRLKRENEDLKTQLKDWECGNNILE